MTAVLQFHGSEARPRLRDPLAVRSTLIGNAVRHANATIVMVTLRWDRPKLVLQVKDNGSGISSARLEKSDGVKLSSMRDRVAQIGAKLA